MEQININLEIKSFTEDGRISGYGAIFNNIDKYGDVIIKGAFAKTLEIKSPKEIKFLYEHNPSKTVGYFTKLNEDDIGLYFEGQLVLGIGDAEKVYKEIKNGIIKSLSIGYITRDYEKKAENRILKEIDLIEISLVSNPANTKANIISVKSFDVDERDNDIIPIEDISDEYKINGKQVFNIIDNKPLLNYKAVKSLTIEDEQENREKIQSFYKAFRKEFKDYTIFSSVCNKTPVIASWSLSDFGRYLKRNETKHLTNSELKIFINRMTELKNYKPNNEIVENKNSNNKNPSDLLDYL